MKEHEKRRGIEDLAPQADPDGQGGDTPFPVGGRRDAGVSYGELMRRLLVETFVPASVLVNRGCEVLSFLGCTGEFLEFPSGEPTRDLFDLLRPGLRSRVRSALQKAVRENLAVADDLAHVRRKNGYFPCRITVTPVREPREARGLYLIVFEESGRPSSGGGGTPAEETSLVAQLDHELRTTREDLRLTIEDLEKSNEELDSAYSNLNHLLVSIDIPTVFLDREMRVRRFTAGSAKLFTLGQSDVGRPWRDVSLPFTDDSLLNDAGGVLESLAPSEREVRTVEGHHYLRRILPYRGTANRIEGVVITFLDITDRIRNDRDTRLLAAVLQHSVDAIFLLDQAGNVTVWNHGAENLYGYSAEEAVGMNARILMPPESANVLLSLLDRAPREASSSSMEKRLTKNGRVLEVWATASLLTDAEGKALGLAVIERDVTQRKRDERELEDRVARRTAALGLVRDVAVQANSGQPVEMILDTCLRRICEFSDWPFAHAYLLNEEDPGVETEAAFYAKPLGDFDPLRRALGGENGRRLRQTARTIGKIQWSPRIDEDLGPEVAGLAGDLHLCSALAFPVMNGERAVAVLEFLLEGRESPGPRILELIASVSSLIANVVERERLKRQLVETTAYEQERLARDLHDAVGQQLAGLTMSAESVYRRLSNEDGSAHVEDLKRIVLGLRETLEGIRGLARGLSNIPVGPGVLAGMLKQLALHVQTVAHDQVTCAADVDDTVEVVDPNAATHLYRIAQEAVHNALTHSQAKKLDIRLRKQGKRLILQVQDDGTGLLATSGQGMGLRIMNQRARLIGAHLEIQTEPGTTVTCTYPKREAPARGRQRDPEAGETAAV